MLASSDSGFLDRVARIEIDEVAAQPARFWDVVVSASDSLELNSQSAVELLRHLSEGAECVLLTKKRSGTPSSPPLVPGRD